MTNVIAAERKEDFEEQRMMNSSALPLTFILFFRFFLLNIYRYFDSSKSAINTRLERVHLLIYIYSVLGFR